MSYQHRFAQGELAQLKTGKVVCVGRNYADHAAELNNPIPTSPLLFIKPSTSVVEMETGFSLPEGLGTVHFETEMAILVGETLTNASQSECESAIAGIGLALDLTLRDLQGQLKEKGQPWEKAKAFDGACPLSAFVKPEHIQNLQDVNIRLDVNEQTRQNGNSAHMLTPVLQLMSYISKFFTLEPGDVVITGTPAGVGEVHSGDKLDVFLADVLHVKTQVK